MRAGRRHRAELTPDELESMQQAYDAGATRASLAKRFGCHESTVDKHVAPRKPSEVTALKLHIRRLEYAVDLLAAAHEENKALRAALESAGVA